MTDIKQVTQQAQTSKLDGANNISKQEYAQIKEAYQKDSQSTESLKWLEQKEPHLHAALSSNLDYDGFVGTTVGSLNLTRSGDELSADAGRRQQGLNHLPPVSDFGADGMPKAMSSGGTPMGKDDHGNAITAYQTGGNTTKVDTAKMASITDADANAARGAQRDYCAKMTGVIGADVGNPPSVNAASGYFKTLAQNGAPPEQIKKEFAEYTQTFFKHPGAGVDWKPALDPKALDKSFAGQPVAKDGKKLIDCEGFAALTEGVLGGCQKGGAPMFDIKHSASSVHVVCGVFVRGKDPKEGFVVDNDSVKDLKSYGDRGGADFNKSSEDAKMRYLLRTHMQGSGSGSATEYGATFSNMKPPPSK